LLGVAGDVSLQDAIGLFEGRGPRQPEFDPEALLEGQESAFNPALGLGGMGMDELDAQFAQDAPDLGKGPGLAEELEFQFVGSLFGGPEEGVTVAVDRHGNAIGGDQLCEQLAIALEVLGEAEAAGQDPTGGIVDGEEQAEARSASFQPIMVRAVDEDHHAKLGLPGAPAVEFGGPVFARAGDAGSLEDAADGRRAEDDVLVLGQQLAEEGIVTSAYSGQVDHRFRFKPTTDSDRNRPVVPAQSDRLGWLASEGAVSWER